MRIGISAIFHFDGGGPAKHLDNLLNEWARHPSEDEYYVFVNENSSKILHLDHARVNVVKASRIANHRIGAVIWHQLVLPILVKKLSIDVLFLSISPFVVLKTCPVVAMIRDLREKRIPGIFSPLRIFYRNRVRNPATTKFSTHLIAISQSTKNDILEFYPVARGKVSVVYHGINPDQNEESDFQTVRDKFGLQRPYILSVGRIDPSGNKNQIRLLQAFELFSRRVETTYRLVLVGPTVRTCAQGNGTFKVLKFLQDYALKDRVVITGYVSGAELMSLYANASFFVFPSLYEGFGHPLLEAMVNSCPICCSNLSSLPEIAGDAAVYFDPYDVEGIASTMLRLESDERLRKVLVANGFKRVKNFSWEVTARQTMSILKSVVTKKE